MKVLMFGWEFPPFNMGGLGTACHGLTKAMVSAGNDVTFVLPKAKKQDIKTHVNLVIANNLEFQGSNGGILKMEEIDSLIHAYLDNKTYKKKYLRYKSIAGLNNTTNSDSDESLYGKNLYEEVSKFSEKAKLIAAFENFDVIHAHDWMTYDAGIKAKNVSGKPLVIHVHATEFDRTGGKGVNQHVYNIERRGMHLADSIIAVSNYTKNIVVQHYGVDPNKVEVVHNAVEFTNYNSDEDNNQLSKQDKIVLFLGRITAQKGPYHFIEVANKISQVEKNVKFVVAGSGDMQDDMMSKVAEMGLSDKVLFSGFLRGKDIDRAFSMADVYVMPSVSEPFGITPLEAMRNGTPCVISKQSGISEILKNCFKVDFWDINHMSNTILSLLRYNELHETMKENGGEEIKNITWDVPAKKCCDVYSKVLSNFV
ncbi:MAG: glycosyltransferase family 4 protein [Nanoarchaeota archaeon]